MFDPLRPSTFRKLGETILDLQQAVGLDKMVRAQALGGRHEVVVEGGEGVVPYSSFGGNQRLMVPRYIVWVTCNTIAAHVNILSLCKI